jgi:hypothetical protein
MSTHAKIGKTIKENFGIEFGEKKAKRRRACYHKKLERIFLKDVRRNEALL